jgi:hypothetical protein
MRPSALLPIALWCAALHLFAGSPATAQDAEGSAPAAVVGGVVVGAVALWSFYPLTGCPMITVGAARPADGCDVAALASALGGVGAGVWTGATDSGAGYGMALGAAGGLGVGWLLNRVVPTPRWVDALLLLGGTVAGGILGTSDEEEDLAAQATVARIPVVALPFF